MENNPFFKGRPTILQSAYRKYSHRHGQSRGKVSLDSGNRLSPLLMQIWPLLPIPLSRILPSAFIEARNVQEAVSGGVKNNPIDPTGKLRAKAHDKDVYGNVPYQRVEYTAESITGFFNMDIGLLRSHNLGQDAFDLLTALALHKVRGFLEQGTRLRTACDLKPSGDLRTTEPAGFTVPSSEELIGFLKDKISKCKGMFASPPVTELKTATVISKGKRSAKETAVEEDDE